MATYSLSGAGVQALSAGVTAAHVTITTTPTNVGSGSANPANYYHIALLRFGDATGYFDAVPVVGGPQWLAVPVGTTRLGYACQNGAVISFAEVIGGSRPFGGADALSSLSDVALTSPADTQLLTYQASSAKWINANAPSGGSGGAGYLLSTRRVKRQHAGNYTITASSFTVVDTTNLSLACTLAVGDIARISLSGQGYMNGSGVAFFDFQVTQPTLGTTRCNNTAAGGIAAEQSASRTPLLISTDFVAAEAGSHTFKLVMFVNANNFSLCNATSGNDDTAILMTLDRIAAAALTA
jgi:hypothetical protein